MVGPLQFRIAESLPLLLQPFPEQVVFFGRLFSEPDRVRHVCVADGLLDARNSIRGLLIDIVELAPDAAILQIGQPAFPVSHHFGSLRFRVFRRCAHPHDPILAQEVYKSEARSVSEMRKWSPFGLRLNLKPGGGGES
jgi:hypothetical protein